VASGVVAVTLLALTEAVSIARALAARSGQHVDGNQEFVGQGLSNLFGSFFSGYVATGSFNRSGVNFAAGAKTPHRRHAGRRVPAGAGAVRGALGAIPAQRRHGRHPVPGGLGPDRLRGDHSMCSRPAARKAASCFPPSPAPCS
jgi:hypothetical protein